MVAIGRWMVWSLVGLAALLALASAAAALSLSVDQGGRYVRPEAEPSPVMIDVSESCQTLRARVVGPATATVTLGDLPPGLIAQVLDEGRATLVEGECKDGLAHGVVTATVEVTYDAPVDVPLHVPVRAVLRSDNPATPEATATGEMVVVPRLGLRWSATGPVRLAGPNGHEAKVAIQVQNLGNGRIHATCAAVSGRTVSIAWDGPIVLAPGESVSLEGTARFLEVGTASVSVLCRVLESPDGGTFETAKAIPIEVEARSAWPVPGPSLPMVLAGVAAFALRLRSSVSPETVK